MDINQIYWMDFFLGGISMVLANLLGAEAIALEDVRTRRSSG